MSSLHHALSDYLAMRRTLGTEYKWPESSLRKFVDFVEAEGSEYVTTELAMRWTLQSEGAQPATYAGRLSIARGFAIWLQAIDSRTQVPQRGLLPAKRHRPKPYIYSEDEISDLMDAADQLRSVSGLRTATFKTLIGLLAATGLRPGEALKLDISDVDPVNGILAVRESKFRKSRVVPLEQTAAAALKAYSTFRDTVLPQRETTSFLVTERGSRPAGFTVRCTFAILCQNVGLRPRLRQRSGRGPRLQDIRHTFATRRLIEWYRADLDVNQLMPSLATYLGHNSTTETYWYIQAVPELLLLATKRMEKASIGVGG